MKELLGFIAILIAAVILGVVVNSLTNGQEIEGRVVDLPEISHKWHLTVIYSYPKDERSQKLYSFIRTNRHLRNLIDQTLFREWDNTSSAMRTEAWSRYIGPQRPAILLQSPAGFYGRSDVVYFARGDSLVIDDNLPKLMQAAINQYMEKKHGPFCPGPFCPRPDPKPKPEPDHSPPPNNVVEIPPTIIDEEEVPSEDIPLWLLLAPLFGAGAGIYRELQNAQD